MRCEGLDEQAACSQGKSGPKQDSHAESEGQEGNSSHTAEVRFRGQSGSEL